MNITVYPSSLSGDYSAAPSKSAAHRVLIAAALSDKPSEIYLPIESEDIVASKACLSALGAQFQRIGKELIVQPISQKVESAQLDCGESGSTLRFMLPIAPCVAEKALFTGIGRLPERPLSPFKEELQKQGCKFSAEKLPFVITGQLQPGTFQLPGDISSQYITGLLFALPMLQEDSRIILSSKLESSGYVDLTLEVLQDFGIEIKQEKDSYLVPGRQKYNSPGRLSVEGDWSNAAFFLVAAALGGTINCADLKLNSSQGDRRILQELEKFGAKVTISANVLTVSPGELQAASVDMSEIPDLLPILAVLASYAPGRSVLHNAARLRLKESDRLSAVRELLQKIGGKVEETADSLIIYGQKELAGAASIDSFNDHRIAMSAAVAALKCKAAVTINNPEVVRKSYPDFFSVYSELGGKCSNVI